MNNIEQTENRTHIVEYKIWRILFNEYKAIQKNSKKNTIRLELNTLLLTISFVNATKEIVTPKENNHDFIKQIQEHFSFFGISNFVKDGNLILTCPKSHIGNLIMAAANNTTYELNNGVLSDILSKTKKK